MLNPTSRPISVSRTRKPRRAFRRRVASGAQRLLRIAARQPPRGKRAEHKTR